MFKENRHLSEGQMATKEACDILSVQFHRGNERQPLPDKQFPAPACQRRVEAGNRVVTSGSFSLSL